MRGGDTSDVIGDLEDECERLRDRSDLAERRLDAARAMWRESGGSAETWRLWQDSVPEGERASTSVTLVSGTEEWDGIYVDGTLCRQASMLNAGHALECLRDLGIVTLGYREVSQEWLNDHGLPATLDDLPAPQGGEDG